MVSDKKHYTIAFVTMMLTTVFWGAGFVLSDIMISNGMTASFINSCRFVSAAILIGIVFNKSIKLDKQTLIIGVIGGAMLTAAFMLQLSALKYTTAANNGFFTASYILFVPFIVWIVKKIRISLCTAIGMGVAIVGFFVLNFGSNAEQQLLIDKPHMWIGNLMTIACAIFYALQIVLSDWALSRRKLHAMSFTFAQLAVAGILFVVYMLIFDLPKIISGNILWKGSIVPLIFVALFGTAFAYTSQINAQKTLTPSTVTLIMSLEAIVGAIISVIAGMDILTWNLIIGGLLVTIAVVIVEFLPSRLATLKARRKNNQHHDN